LIRLSTGDGMALVFSNSAEAPVECAMEISKALKRYPQIQLRMGVHSGPVNAVSDVNDRSNVTGAGINMRAAGNGLRRCRAHPSPPGMSQKTWSNTGSGNRACTISANAKSNMACAFTS
jgi:hypothetical protein